jgi:hypothetical protein
MHSYDTVTAALDDLKDRGFTRDFNIAFNKLECSVTQQCLNPEQFEIVEHYRFEGTSDPGDEAVVYAVQEKSGGMKGTLVSAYGAYSDSISEEMIQKLAIDE